MSSREEFDRLRYDVLHDSEHDSETTNWCLDLLDEVAAAYDAEIEALRAQVEEARRFGEMAAEQHNELLRRTITCAFCGAAYPDETPASGAEVLTKHIATCERHPMRLVEAERDTALAEAAGMREACLDVCLYGDINEFETPEGLDEEQRVRSACAAAIRALPPKWEPDLTAAAREYRRRIYAPQPGDGPLTAADLEDARAIVREAGWRGGE